jgi:multidrug resistance efflux pump
VALSWDRIKAVFRYDLIWRTLIFITSLVVLFVIVTRWNQWASDSVWQSTDDAFLQSDLTPIASKIAGYIRALPVQDFDRVHAGDVLAEIVDDDYRAAVAQINASPRKIKPGQYVGDGGQITTLTPLPHVWVIANYKETQLTHMQVGQPAANTVETFPGHKLTLQ